MKVPYWDTAKFLADYEAAVQWLHAITGRRDSRWMTYLNDLRAYEPAFASGDFRRVRANSLKGLLNTYFEAHMLVEIHQALSGHSSDGVKKTLRNVIKGQLSYDQDGTNARGRNHMFELQMAATLKNLGYHLQFSGDYDCGIFHFGKGNIAVECKRPQSEASLLDVIEESISQIDRRVESKDAFCGISAINVDLVVNKDFKMIEAQDETELRRDLRDSIVPLTQKYKERLRGRYMGRHCLGVVFQLRAMSRIPEHGYPIVTRMVAPIDLVDRGHPHFDYLLDLQRRFASKFQLD